MGEGYFTYCYLVKMQYSHVMLGAVATAVLVKGSLTLQIGFALTLDRVFQFLLRVVCVCCVCIETVVCVFYCYHNFLRNIVRSCPFNYILHTFLHDLKYFFFFLFTELIMIINTSTKKSPVVECFLKE